ncbi:MAG: AarF/ABC1/UbiB kinase family protein, partial [Deltaproteobacteria bacterium]
GEKVVVKVQRPNLETIIANDLDILRVLARMIETRIPESRQYDPVGIVEEFARSIRKEIDFRRELHNIERFAKNFEGKAFVYTPKAFRSHSSAHVLTMEFIEGIPAYDFEAMDRAGLDRKLLAERGTQAILQQIFVDGFFHADPHPGNIFALPGNVVCFIDYGMMGTVDDERVDELLVFLVSILTNDLDKMVNLFYRLELINEDVNVRAMKGEIKDIITRYYNQPLKDIDIAVFIQEIFEVIQRYHVIIPSDLLLMSKAIATIEGIAQELYPDYDPITQMRDFLLKIYIRRLADPQYLARGMSRNIEEVLYLLKRLPKDLGSIIGKLRKGELTLTIREEAWAQRALLENRRTNRIVVAMLILAINIGAPILLTRPSGPVLFGLKLSVLVGVVGLTLSILLTVLLLLAVWRSDLF